MLKNMLIKFGIISKRNYVPDCKIYKDENNKWYAKVTVYHSCIDGLIQDYQNSEKYDTIDELVLKIYSDAAKSHLYDLKSDIKEKNVQTVM